MKVRARDYTIAAFLLVGFAAVAALFGLLPSDVESPLTSLRHLRNVVVAYDQPASGQAVIAYAAASEPSFIAVTDEVSGAILAVSRLLPPGEARAILVPVEGGLTPGFRYATLRRDDGDGRFDDGKDAPARDVRGAAAITRFLVTDGASR